MPLTSIGHWKPACSGCSSLKSPSPSSFSSEVLPKRLKCLFTHPFPQWPVPAFGSPYSLAILPCPIKCKAHFLRGMATSWVQKGDASLIEFCWAAIWVLSTLSPSTTTGSVCTKRCSVCEESSKESSAAALRVQSLGKELAFSWQDTPFWSYCLVDACLAYYT